MTDDLRYYSLQEDEPNHSVRRLIFIGIPSFLVALFLSSFSHTLAHIVVGNVACGAKPAHMEHIMNVMDLRPSGASCALSAVAGPLWTFGLGLVFFMLLLRFPSNLFIASMAFINATIRLPETLMTFYQLLLHDKSFLNVDESTSLALLRYKDATVPTVVMCFYSILLVFFALFVIHDIKRVPKKWIIAGILFLLLGSLETILWKVTPLFS